MAFCTTCGHSLDESARFCIRCGQMQAGSAPAVAAAAPAFSRMRFQFDGDGMALLIIRFKIFFLSIFTLGIYSFWGRTRRRRYIAEHARLAGDAFAYHGTGMELLIGALKAVGILILLHAQMFAFMFGLGEKKGVIIGALVLFGGILAVIPFAIVGAWRYRMSRTSYRGIRFSFRGTAEQFAPMWIGYALLSLITLGICTPLLLHKVREYYAKNAYYGNSRFDYDGKSSDLMTPWIIAWLLMLPTIGISMVWFKVQQFNYQWSRTTFGGARFVPSVTMCEYIILLLLNWLLTVFTLGIGLTWAQVNLMKFMADHLRLDGYVDWAQIQQQFLDAAATGEGISTMLDTSATDIGLGL